MEYQIELAPIQIQLNSEIYSYLGPFLNIKLNKEEIEKVKSSIRIIDIDEKKFMTTISINYVSSEVKSLILEKNDFLFIQGNIEKILQPTYNKIVELSNENLKELNIQQFFSIYLKHLLNTLLIDIFSDHFSGLVQYIVKMALRKQFQIKEVHILTNNLLNELLAFEPDFNLLNKYLLDQYWTSSRHLGLVNNDWVPIRSRIEKINTKNHELIEWIKNNISKDILEKFEFYLQCSKELSNLKILDAQIQIRAAYLLKLFLKNYIKKNKAKNDYIWDIKKSEELTQYIIRDYEESLKELNVE